MAFLGGAECSTATNPLAQFSKITQDDKSLQRDRLVGRTPGAGFESMRSQIPGGQNDRMMESFLQQPSLSQQTSRPFAMEQMRRDLDSFAAAVPQTNSPSWTAEFGNGDYSHIEAPFHPMQKPSSPAFNSAEFQKFQHMNGGSAASARIASPSQNNSMNGYQRPMGLNYGMGIGGMGMMNNYRLMTRNTLQRPTSEATLDKGKGRMVELDDQNWEQQFAEMDALRDGQQDVDALDNEANAAMEAELNGIDRDLNTTDFTSLHDLDSSDLDPWAEFDSLDPSASASSAFRDPQLGSYLFEDDNIFRATPNPYEEGLAILSSAGNLSLAALAFEAAVQKDPSHVEAWTALGSAQAQNEKETPAIRALEQALKLSPDNLDALMGLAVSYTNEGYDATAYRTLERWLSVKYPSIVSPQSLSSPAEIGFTDRHALHEKVTSLFIRAAQLSPSGNSMDPDVQVGLGVLFYGAEEYDKAVDCFSAALASSETGTTNSQGQVHLLWNRLGATLANSGRSEEAIAAYERALGTNANFVRARYNLGVSCINMGCLEEAAQHLLGALSMHEVVEREGRERVEEIKGMGRGGGGVRGGNGMDGLESANGMVGSESAGGSGNGLEWTEGGGIDEARLSRLMAMNQSSNLYETLRRVFGQMGRRDLAEKVVPGVDVGVFRGEFEF